MKEELHLMPAVNAQEIQKLQDSVKEELHLMKAAYAQAIQNSSIL